MPAVYCALDPATAILEIAVHKGFKTLNAVPHVLSSAELRVPWPGVHVVQPDVPNKLWLYPSAFAPLSRPSATSCSKPISSWLFPVPSRGVAGT